MTEPRLPKDLPPELKAALERVLHRMSRATLDKILNDVNRRVQEGLSPAAPGFIERMLEEFGVELEES
jgi:hypothetical protein